MIETLGPIIKVGKRDIKQMKDKPAEASIWLESALTLKTLRYNDPNVDIAFGNAIAINPKCWNAYAHRAAYSRTSEKPDLKSAMSDAKKATRVKVVITQPKSEAQVEKAIEGTKAALAKQDGVSLLGIYNQLVLEKDALKDKVKEGKKDTETKKNIDGAYSLCESHYIRDCAAALPLT